ncbi:MAG: nucleotide exchange factor GrpE [Micavibrio sp.]|nr:nucleotide exchange factor GrpE [Micavibrio sp.]
MTNTPEKSQQNSNNAESETLAERSARLEAEAAAMAQRDATLHYEHMSEEEDPLAPSAIEDEDTDSANDATENSLGAEQTKAIIQSLQNELESARDTVARAMAEAENTRRRARKDAEDAGKFAITKFAKDILEISDTLTRALNSAPHDLAESEPRLKSFLEGMDATQRILLKSFEKNGIVKLEPMDEPFNPNFHEVMFEAPVPGKPAGIVMQVLEPGYMINDRLLRAAKVGITKEDPSAPPTQGPEKGGQIDIGA